MSSKLQSTVPSIGGRDPEYHEKLQAFFWSGLQGLQELLPSSWTASQVSGRLLFYKCMEACGVIGFRDLAEIKREILSILKFKKMDNGFGRH